VVICNARDKFLLTKSTKKVHRRVNFTNLKTSGGYIAKSKSQGICLQLSQTPGGDYAIWPKRYLHVGTHYVLSTKKILIHQVVKLQGLVVGVSRYVNLDSPVHFPCTGGVSIFCNKS
jgi:hypothetical protein